MQREQCKTQQGIIRFIWDGNGAHGDIQSKPVEEAKSFVNQKSESIAEKFSKLEKITWKGIPKTRFWWLF